jgi:SAM-dependent methyltransferase
MSRLLTRWRKPPAPVAASPRSPGRRPFADARPQSLPPVEVPPVDAVTVRQWLWGSGFIMPGNAEYVLGLVKPFGLNPAMSMLDVRAGLGGTARLVAETFGTYVTGLERDPDLAQRGMEMSVAQGMVKHAPVNPLDPETFELRQGAFDCIFGRAATHDVVDKERFLRVLFLGLKPRGQLLLSEFVINPDAADRPELATWAAEQSYRPSLWTLRQYTDCLTSLGFEVRITEDTTATVRSHIIMGWDQLLRTVDLRSLPRQHLVAVVDEAERSMHVVAALDSGALKTYRLYAIAGRARMSG